MKKILITVLVLVLLGLVYYLVSARNVRAPESDSGRIMNPQGELTTSSGEKLKTVSFTGTLEIVDTGCFADGECYVVVDGKHITTMMGWSRAVWGSVLSNDGIGGLEDHIGDEVEVYAQDKTDGTYTLEGSEEFYIKIK